MSRPIALLSGDGHLMKHAWTDRKTLSGDAEYGLWQLASLARRSGLPLVLAGDQFDSMSPDRSMMIRAAEFLADVSGCYIQGNHDKVYPSWMKLVARHWTHLDEQGVDFGSHVSHGALPEDCHTTPELEPLFEDEKNWRVYGADYLLSSELLQERLHALEQTIEKDPAFANLLVLHQSAVPYAPAFACEMLDGMLPECFDMLLIGHVHEPKTATIRNRNGKAIPTISPGGVHLLDITENPHKKLYVLYSNGSVRSLALQTRHRHRIDLSGLDTAEIRLQLEPVRRALVTAGPRPKVIETPILYVLCDADAKKELRTLLESEFGQRVHVFLKDKSEQEKTPTLLQSQRCEEVDLQRHAEDGFLYAKEVIRRYENDEDVQKIIDTILVSEIDADVYTSLKTDFQERNHVEDQLRHAGELLPA